MPYDFPTAVAGSPEEPWRGQRKAEPLQRKTLSVFEATQVLGISKWTLYDLIRRNELKTIKLGARRLILMDEIDALIERKRYG